MGIRWNRGAYECRVYSPKTKKLEYVGRRKLERDAKRLFREKTEELAGSKQPAGLTIRAYADDWLEIHHGPGTRRPAKGTRQVNGMNVRRFVEDFGDRLIDGGVRRREALAWGRSIPHVAKSVAAMYQDAIDDEETTGNPFANLRYDRSRGRKDIAPITEDELGRLASIALEHWGPDGYGQIARAWVLFGAWVGCRPGETFSVPLRGLDFHQGLVKIKRVKKRGKEGYPTDTVVLSKTAADAVRDALPLLAHEGPMFRTVSGRTMAHGVGWHWNPIRDKFETTVSEERWEALKEGQDEFAFYSLRHFCASIMVDRGGNEFDGAAQLGNSPQVFRETYMHDYKDRVLERNRRLLDAPGVVELQSIRDRRGA